MTRKYIQFLIKNEILLKIYDSAISTGRHLSEMNINLNMIAPKKMKENRIIYRVIYYLKDKIWDDYSLGYFIPQRFLLSILLCIFILIFCIIK